MLAVNLWLWLLAVDRLAGVEDKAGGVLGKGCDSKKSTTQIHHFNSPKTVSFLADRYGKGR